MDSLRKVGRITTILLLCLVCSAQNYSHSCTSSGAGDVDYFIAYFNDPDGDCISDDWSTDYFLTNGGVMTITSQDWIDAGGDPTIDFNYWDCCEVITGGGEIDDNISLCPCEWFYDVGSQPLIFDCSGCE